MKLETQTIRFGWKHKHAQIMPLALIHLGLIVVTSAAKAQEVIASAPASSLQTISQQSEPSIFQVFAPSSVFSSKDQPFEWGPVVARPHVQYQFLYGTGIQSSPGNQQATVIQQVSPGITIDLGTHWALDYTPTLMFYSDSNFKNQVNHAVTLTGNNSYQDWTFGLSQTYNYSSSPQVATAAQTDQETYNTSLTASYAFNEEMSLDLEVDQNLLFAANYQGSRNWSTMDWLNYQFWPRLNAGIGAGFGYTGVDSGPNQTYEDLAGRVNWRATDKISVALNAGFEERQFLGGANSLFNPTFGLAIQYQPFEQTQLSLNATRSVNPSYFQNQITENTIISGNVNQRLLGQFYLGLSAGYSITTYVGSTTTANVNREDDSPTFSVNLSHAFFKRGNVAVFYNYSKNSSNATGYSFSSNQVGFNIGYSY